MQKRFLHHRPFENYLLTCYSNDTLDKTMLVWPLENTLPHKNTWLVPYHALQKRKASSCHDDVIKWKDFPRNWPFVWGIHRFPVNSPHKGQCRGALMLSFICVWINGWVNNRGAGDSRRYRSHYDVTVMRRGHYLLSIVPYSMGLPNTNHRSLKNIIYTPPSHRQVGNDNYSLCAVYVQYIHLGPLLPTWFNQDYNIDTFLWHVSSIT